MALRVGGRVGMPSKRYSDRAISPRIDHSITMQLEEPGEQMGQKNWQYSAKCVRNCVGLR